VGAAGGTTGVGMGAAIGFGAGAGFFTTTFLMAFFAAFFTTALFAAFFTTFLTAFFVPLFLAFFGDAFFALLFFFAMDLTPCSWNMTCGKAARPSFARFLILPLRRRKYHANLPARQGEPGKSFDCGHCYSKNRHAP
jgi:hypothetical protein